jgi:hypothetical protein
LDIADGQNRLERIGKLVLTNQDQCQQRALKRKQATQHGQQPQCEVTADAVVATNIVHMQISKGSGTSSEQAPNPMAVPSAVHMQTSKMVALISHQALDPVAVPSIVHSQRSTVLATTSKQASNPVAAPSATALFRKLPMPKSGPTQIAQSPVGGGRRVPATNTVRRVSSNAPALCVNQLQLPTSLQQGGCYGAARNGHMPHQVPIPRSVPSKEKQPQATIHLLDPAKHVPLQWGVPLNKPQTLPTRETCPPPVLELTLSQEIKGKIERANQACDAPSFDLGIDIPQKVDNQLPSKNADQSTTRITPVGLRSTSFAILDD